MNSHWLAKILALIGTKIKSRSIRVQCWKNRAAYWPRLRAALGKAFIKWKGEPHEEAKQRHIANFPVWRQHFLR
jgi:hypothetical protein